jgi:hypothetical protein
VRHGRRRGGRRCRTCWPDTSHSSACRDSLDWNAAQCRCGWRSAPHIVAAAWPYGRTRHGECPVALRTSRIPPALLQ